MLEKIKNIKEQNFEPKKEFLKSIWSKFQKIVNVEGCFLNFTVLWESKSEKTSQIKYKTHDYERILSSMIWSDGSTNGINAKWA